MQIHQKMEEVLCVPRHELPDAWLKPISVCRLDPHVFLETISQIGMVWQTRNLAEKDMSHKQLIPYVVLQTSNQELTACYHRAGSEKRLHNLWSIGIGGHINRMDASGNALSLPSVIERGLNREIREELGYLPSNTLPEFIGIINEEHTEVGQVHLGLVYCLTIHDQGLIRADAELSRFQWVDTKAVTHRNLERWSVLAIELLNQLDG